MTRHTSNLTLQTPTREGPGCISYVLHQATDGVCSFVFVEEWTGQAALDEHLQTPYLQDFLAQADDIPAEPLDITMWRRLA